MTLLSLVVPILALSVAAVAPPWTASDALNAIGQSLDEGDYPSFLLKVKGRIQSHSVPEIVTALPIPEESVVEDLVGIISRSEFLSGFVYPRNRRRDLESEENSDWNLLPQPVQECFQAFLDDLTEVFLRTSTLQHEPSMEDLVPEALPHLLERQLKRRSAFGESVGEESNERKTGDGEHVNPDSFAYVMLDELPDELADDEFMAYPPRPHGRSLTSNLPEVGARAAYLARRSAVSWIDYLIQESNKLKNSATMTLVLVDIKEQILHLQPQDFRRDTRGLFSDWGVAENEFESALFALRHRSKLVDNLLSALHDVGVE
ncbi:hypothetical protein DACRYDRAFT_18349 [Dacryopinax primogenitus]|uniref:Uncharacterized protein n=1 Tax=Dacryopinax primogenitus (strain DJM 731) TaxID=1858805 RepID=M5G1Z9_DACPD|nr:uncharacterized protein DACRYDRAFT_18349 [Dacryopinax primogenitus]EJT97787.1 hypothetical protein DACRYDRAFT_18349 [Dacryopinax primogenitus]